jgi:hypothetical protein
MNKERDAEAGAAVAIALAVLPTSAVAYCALSLALMVLAARIVWLTVHTRAARLIGSLVALILLSLVLVPEMIGRMGR